MQEKQGIHRSNVFQTYVTGLVGNSYPDLHPEMRLPIALIRSRLGSLRGGLSARKIGNHVQWIAVFCGRLADLRWVRAYSSDIFRRSFSRRWAGHVGYALTDHVKSTSRSKRLWCRQSAWRLCSSEAILFRSSPRTFCGSLGSVRSILPCLV
jgi:hypothetical protein